MTVGLQLTTRHVIDWHISKMEEAKVLMVGRERDGLPRIVQHVVHNYATKLFIVRLFNGQYLLLDDGVAGLGLFDVPKREDFADLEAYVEQLVAEHMVILTT